MNPFDDRGDRMRFIENPFILLTPVLLTFIGVLWFSWNELPQVGWRYDGDLFSGQFSNGLLTAVVQSSLVGVVVYCLALAYFEGDAARENG